MKQKPVKPSLRTIHETSAYQAPDADDDDSEDLVANEHLVERNNSPYSKLGKYNQRKHPNHGNAYKRKNQNGTFASSYAYSVIEVSKSSRTTTVVNATKNLSQRSTVTSNTKPLPKAGKPSI